MLKKWAIMTPRGYMSYGNGTYRVIQDGIPICANKFTMQEATQEALHANVTMASISWNGDMKQWVTAHTLGKTNDVVVANSMSRYAELID